MELYYDFTKDFREVKNIFIEESLSTEELKEGLEPILYDIRVCLTKHAYHRMYEVENRDISWEEIEYILLSMGEELLNLRNNEEFAIMTKDKTIAIFGNAHYQDGELALIVHTIVRVKENNTGNYKKLVARSTDNVIIVAV